VNSSLKKKRKNLKKLVAFLRVKNFEDFLVITVKDHLIVLFNL
jgi:hypothetical protein